MPYNIILYFRLPYFHVSNCALFSTWYFSTLIFIDLVLTLSIIIINLKITVYVVDNGDCPIDANYTLLNNLG